MLTCVICNTNLVGNEPKCFECGFSTSIPVFLSEEQYQEWNRTIVASYRKNFLEQQMQERELAAAKKEEMKKKLQEESENLARKLVTLKFREKVNKIVRIISQEAALSVCRTVEKYCQEDARSQISKLLKDFENKNAKCVPKIMELYMDETQPEMSQIKVESVLKNETESSGMSIAEIEKDMQGFKVALDEQQIQDCRKKAENNAEVILLESDCEKVIASISNSINNILSQQIQEKTVEEGMVNLKKILKEIEITEAVEEQVNHELEQLISDKNTETVRMVREVVEKELTLIAKNIVKQKVENVEMKLQLESRKHESVKVEKQKWNHLCAYGKAFYIKTSDEGLVFGGRDRYEINKNINQWKNIVAIAVGDFHVVALDAAGNVYAAGKNDMGQCDTVLWNHIVQITACGAHTAALDSMGHVYVCGDNDENLKAAEKWTGIKKISLGTHHILGLEQDGTVKAIGYDDDEQCSNVSTWHDVVDIAAGSYHSIGLCKDGTVVASGINLDGECEINQWREMVVIYAGNGVSAGIDKKGNCIFAGKTDFESDIRKHIINSNILQLELSKSGENRCYVLYELLSC